MRKRSPYYEELGFAKVDTHRPHRTGFSEVIYCDGKTDSQIITIAEKLMKAHGYAVASKVSESQGRALKKEFGKISLKHDARIAIIGDVPKKTLKNGIAILTAGTSDIPVAEEAAVIAEIKGHKPDRIYDVGVAGVHRLLHHSDRIAKCTVLIVVAGMEGALPSIVGGLYGKPLIAVPTSVGYGSNFKGLSALLTMLNSCSPGIAVVNIDNGFGAGYLASLINDLTS